MHLQHIIRAVIRPGEQSGYVAECVEIPVVTQGGTLDETVANLREAIELQLEEVDLEEIGLAAEPIVVITMELETVHA